MNCLWNRSQNLSKYDEPYVACQSKIRWRGKREIIAFAETQWRILVKFSFHCIFQNCSIFCSQNSYERETCWIKEKAKTRIRVKAFSVARLLSRTSKDNSRNYGDFSEEFREIDVILLTGHSRFFVGSNTLWDVTDKGGNRSTEHKWDFTSIAVCMYTCLVYIVGSSLPLCVCTVKFFTLMLETNKSVVCIRGTFISTL